MPNCEVENSVHACGVVNQNSQGRRYRQNDVVVRGEDFKNIVQVFKVPTVTNLGFLPEQEMVNSLGMSRVPPREANGKEEWERGVRGLVFQDSSPMVPQRAGAWYTSMNFIRPSGAIRVVPENNGLPQQEYIRRLVLLAVVRELSYSDSGRSNHLFCGYKESPGNGESPLVYVLRRFKYMLTTTEHGLDGMVKSLGIMDPVNHILNHDMQLHEVINAVDADNPGCDVGETGNSLLKKVAVVPNLEQLFSSYVLCGLAPHRESLLKHGIDGSSSDNLREVNKRRDFDREAEKARDAFVSHAGLSVEPTTDALRLEMRNKMRLAVRFAGWELADSTTK